MFQENMETVSHSDSPVRLTICCFQKHFTLPLSRKMLQETLLCMGILSEIEPTILKGMRQSESLKIKITSPNTTTPTPSLLTWVLNIISYQRVLCISEKHAWISS